MRKLLDPLCGNRYITGSISSTEKSLLAKSVLHGNRGVYSTVSHSVINTFVLLGVTKWMLQAMYIRRFYYKSIP